MSDQAQLLTPRSAARPPELPVRAVFAVAFALGVAGDVLLRAPEGPGLNFTLLFAGLGIAVWALARRAGLALSPEALVSLAAGVTFAATFMLRASEALQFFAFLCVAVAFSLPTLRAGAAWLRRSSVSDQVSAVAGTAANGALGAFRLIGAAITDRPAHGSHLVSHEADPASSPRSGWAVLRGLLLAMPFLLVFGALFMSADRVFAGLVTDLVDMDIQEIAGHLLVTAVLTWLACGYLTGFLTGTRPIGLPEGLGSRPSVGVVEIGTALALVDLLFLLFVSVQFRYLFGGAGLVEVTPGLTYAEYAREGFAQLALACALVLPSLLAADWLLHPRRERDTVVFRALGGLLLLLLVVLIASALQRVRAYQAAYGLTDSRFYGAAFLGWVTLLTVWFAVTVLRGRRERFAFPALVSAFAFISLLVVVNPDARIASANLERATHETVMVDRSGDGIDVAYLASLSADAVPTLMDRLHTLPPEPRCVLARRMLERWGPDAARQPDWRSWNWSVARARGAVGAEAATLRAAVVDAEPGACPPRER